MIDLSWILTDLLWVAPIISAVIAAVLAGVATYVAVYWIERKKWTANAAIVRKDQVYSPVYDELASLVDKLESEEGQREIWPRQALKKWRELSHRSFALELPEALTQRLDGFVELCDAYMDSYNQLSWQIMDAFPKKYLGQADSSVAKLLADRMLLGLGKDCELLVYLGKERSRKDGDLLACWTAERFVEDRRKIENLSAWTRTRESCDKYVEELHSLHDELGKRMRRIAERYQRAAPDL